ncbi:hypothetical protein [Piscicoccus intestinalis]|uniref:hypothetical protein n=1 Tax=Piscicoccus intestinalis TaxID=746033 RepID=UPI0012EDE0BF|nr:hypothetical protein [Piscicoccus intestinalis]
MSQSNSGRQPADEPYPTPSGQADGTGAEVEPELNDTYGMAEVQEEDESDSADE